MNMQQQVLVSLSFFSCVMYGIDLKIEAANTQGIPVTLWYKADAKDDTIAPIAHKMAHCFSFTKQCVVSVASADEMPSKKQIRAVKEKEKSLLLVVLSSLKDKYEWRVYDTMTGLLLQTRQYRKKETLPRIVAYALADQIWPLLTGQEGFFSTKIAYCKKVINKHVKHIYIADFDGSNEQAMVEAPTINIAPRWNHNRSRPLLFYSDYAPMNVRLKVADLSKKTYVASNFDGLNMIPAFCDDGSKVVYCVSQGNGCCQLYYHDKNCFKNITQNQGNNVSPSFSADGNMVFFCSDFETRSPQLYVYNVATNVTERLTSGGYCASPRYSSQAHKIAYSKLIAGVMQLFVYDVASKQHEQLTTDNANKQECAWSPCGNWLIYSIGLPCKPSRIAMMNRHSKVSQFLTEAAYDCNYPDWSPRYDQFPLVAEA